jgi:hypothetical protein
MSDKKRREWGRALAGAKIILLPSHDHHLFCVFEGRREKSGGVMKKRKRARGGMMNR